MPENKDQHFVPKFLMRQFSSDPRCESDRKWINLYLLKTRKFIPNASIAGQCQRPYFYGKDIELEKMFGELEGRTKSLLGDLSPNALSKLKSGELFEIKLFTYIQNMRSLETANRVDQVFDIMMKSVVEREAKELGIGSDQYKIHHKSPQLMALMTAFEAIPLLEDLKLCFLYNRDGTDFVLSDHPTTSYNQFGEHHPWLGPRYSSACGIASKGIQLFMPLSPKLCAAVYDPSTYHYGHDLVLNINAADAWKINILQASNTQSCLYIKTDAPDLKSLKRLAVLNKRAECQRHAHVWKSPIMNEPNGGQSQLTGVGMPDIRLGIKFSFISIVSTIDYTGYNLGAFPPRSFEQVEQVRRFRDKLRLNSDQAANQPPKQSRP